MSAALVGTTATGVTLTSGADCVVGCVVEVSAGFVVVVISLVFVVLAAAVMLFVDRGVAGGISV